jgi:hypothetical protein
MKEFKTKIGFAIIALLFSIIIGTFLPSVITYFSRGNLSITLGEQFIIGICSFIAISFIEFLYFYNLSLQYTMKEHKFWEIKINGDNELYNIRTNFHKVVEDSKSENDIFILHFQKEFKKLQRKIFDVAEKKELFVAADYFLNADNVLKIFPSFEESKWRYVWKIDKIDEPLFDEHAWRSFFEKTAKMVLAGKMKEIRAIIVLSKIEFLESERIKKLLDFFKTNTNIDCKLITYKSYENVCKYNSVETSLADFGLYGSQLLFTEKYNEGEVSGFFSKDSFHISDYSNLFERFWESNTITEVNPSIESITIDVDTLIKFDLNFKDNG